MPNTVSFEIGRNKITAVAFRKESYEHMPRLLPLGHSRTLLFHYLNCDHYFLEAHSAFVFHSFEVQCRMGRAVASWFVTLIRMHMHAGSSPEWGTVRTGPLASLLTLSFFVLSRQRLKMRVLGVDVET